MGCPGLLSPLDFSLSFHPVPKDVRVCEVTLAWLIQGAFIPPGPGCNSPPKSTRGDGSEVHWKLFFSFISQSLSMTVVLLGLFQQL